MLSTLRTYRFLSLTLGLAVLFGMAAPSIQAACAMVNHEAPAASHSMPMPCHDAAMDAEASAAPMRAALTSDASVSEASIPERSSVASCTERPAHDLHACCTTDAGPASRAVVSETAPRVLVALVHVLPAGLLEAAPARTTHAVGPPDDLPAPPLSNRLAHLATFLN